MSTSGVEISGSRVDAASTNDCAVYSPEDIDITDSVVKADAPEGIEGILTDGTASASSSWIESSGVDDVINAENSVVFKMCIRDSFLSLQASFFLQKAL